MGWLTGIFSTAGGTAAGGATAAAGGTSFSAGGAGFSAAPLASNAAPASFYSGAGTSAGVGAISSGAPYAQGAGPVDVNQGFSLSQPMSGSANAGGDSPSLFGFKLPTAEAPLQGITEIAQGIAAYKQGKAEAELAKKLAAENAIRVYTRLRGIAETGRTIGAAQGTTGTGSERILYGANLNAARLGANTALFQGQAQAMALRRAAELRLRAGILRGTNAILTSKY